MCETVAFPLFSSGIFSYPKYQALRVAADTVGEFLLENDMSVYISIRGELMKNKLLKAMYDCFYTPPELTAAKQS